MAPREVESCQPLLERHQVRRLQGIPTLSVLAGPVGLGIRAWRAWSAGRGIRVVLISPTRTEDVVVAWVKAIAEQNDLIAAALAWLASRTSSRPEELHLRLPAMTLHELERMWMAHGLDEGRDSPSALVRLLLTRRITDPGRDPKETITELRAASPLEDGSFLSQLAALVPADRLPAFLAALPAERDSSVHAAWVRLLETYVKAVPALPCAIAISAGGMNHLLEQALKQAAEGHWHALLREGTIPIHGPEAPALRERLRGSGIDPEPLERTVAQLAAVGASADLAESFVQAARPPVPTEGQEDRARSVEERFLFEYLESLPETTGLFALNGVLEFRHGHLPAEVDLVARDLLVAIELDGGYYHLGSQEAYRRDRRKDWLLQQHGYLVLRFLAEDVVPRLEEILTTILTAVEMRRLIPSSGKPTHECDRR